MNGKKIAKKGNYCLLPAANKGGRLAYSYIKFIVQPELLTAENNNCRFLGGPIFGALRSCAKIKPVN